MSILADLFTFASVFLLILSLFGLAGLARRPVERRLEDVRIRTLPGTGSAASLTLPSRKSMVAVLGERVAPMEAIRQSATKRRLAGAGFYSDASYYSYWGFKVLLLLLFPLAWTAVLLAFSLPPSRQGLKLLFFAFLGFYLPDLILYLIQKKRHEQIFCGMPDMLDLLVVCVEAGLGLDAALQKVSEEFHLSNPTLSGELRITCTSIRLGQARDDALHDLGVRTGSRDLKSFISVVVQSERFGTGIAQALRTHADDLRTRRRQRAEELAAKTAVKLIFPLVLFIFPAIFVVTAGPSMIRIYEQFIKKNPF